MDEEDVLAAELMANLSRCLNKRLALDVADRSTDLGDDDVGCGIEFSLKSHSTLDFVRDVRNDLNGVTEILSVPFTLDHAGVNLTRCDVSRPVQVDVEKTLVVPDVEVGLGSVVRYENLTVLERVHRAGVDVEVGVEFLHHHSQATTRQKVTERGSSEAFAEGGNNASGHENVPRHDPSGVKICIPHHGI